MKREIEVWADWRELGSPVLMGQLRSSLIRGKEVFSFTYDTAWLVGGHSHQLDPDLRLFGGDCIPVARTGQISECFLIRLRTVGDGC